MLPFLPLALFLVGQAPMRHSPQTVRLPGTGTAISNRTQEEVERSKRVASAAAKASREGGRLLATGKNVEAEKALRAALVEHPRTVPARSLLAEALIRQGNDAEALSLLEGLRGNHYMWSEGDAARTALLQARLGQTQASRAAWSPEIVMRYCDGVPEARASLPSVVDAKSLKTAWTIAVGYLTDLRGDDTGATFYYGRALALDPRNAFVNLKTGDLELRTGKAASAASRYALAALSTGRMKEAALRQEAVARSIAARAKPVATAP